MKTFIKLLSLFAVLTFALVPAVPALAQEQDTTNSISFQTFYDQLASQGTWIQTSDYGYVFQPTVNDPNWRPYTYGHWVDTDDGMMWVSDEPFGWATDHYGRWVNLDGYGWVWVPGYTWAPAWVSWREGDDECGWAPLPPDTMADVDYYGDYGDDYGWDWGFHIGDDCDLAFGIGPGCYNFCPIAFIGDRDCWRHFRDHRDNFAFIDRTRNVTNLNVSRDARGDRFGRVHAGGPSVADLNARSRTPIRHVGLTSASSVAANGRMNGNSLSVFAPNVNRQGATDARPHSVSGTLAQTRVNRGTNINDPQAVNSRIKPASATSQQIRAATMAGTGAAGSAKVATTQTHFSRSLRQPLTALHPNVAAGQQPARVGAGNRSDRFGTPHVSTPSVPGESRYTGKARAPQTMTRANTIPRANTFTATPRVSAPSFNPPSRFTGETVAPRTTTRTYSSAGGYRSYAPAPSYHPVFHTTPTYHPQPSFRSSAPAFHSSAPAFHSQPSFHVAAPAQHFGGGAPAARASSGGGGGRPSGGGGQSGGQRGR